MRISPFAKAGFSPNVDINSPYLTVQQKSDLQNANTVVYSGGDLAAYINNSRVGNLESITWSVSREMAPNYAMGDHNPKSFTKGKRVIVGSMVFTQYDRHAVIEQVFGLSKLGIRTIGDMWTADVNVGLNNVADSLRRGTAQYIGTRSTVGVAGAVTGTQEFGFAPNVLQESNIILRGVDSATFNQELTNQLRNTAALVAARRVNYSDQIPAFDLTLIGVTEGGQASRCAIFGLEITQETSGYSQNDLGSSVGISFVCKAVDYWKAIELDPQKGTAMIPAVG